MPKTMRAVVKDKTGACGVVEAFIPRPKARELLIRVKAVSVNHGDWAKGAPLHRGEPGRRHSIMCSDVAGIVEDCGAKVNGFKAGDEVCAVTLGLKGALAEYAVVKQAWCSHKPQDISWELAASLPSAGVTALAAVEKIPSKCSRALVVGASGGVGQFALTLAAQGSFEVDVVCGNRSFAAAKRLGASYAFDYAQGLDSIPHTYDAILAVNGVYPAGDYLRLIKPGGSLVLVGLDSLKPSMLIAFVKGIKLRVALFFASIGKGGLQKTCDLLAAADEIPSIEVVSGLNAGVKRLVTLADDHPRGKLVVTI